MNDPSLAQQLDTNWGKIFERELSSNDIETVRTGLETTVGLLEKQDTTIWRLKLAFGASLVTILCLSGYILTKNNKNDMGRRGDISEQKVSTDNLEPTLQNMAKKFEWIEDPVEKQLRKLRGQ